MSYLIDDLLPEQNIHILGSTAGALVRQFLTHTLTLFSKGEPVLGHDSHPCPFLFLTTSIPVNLLDEGMSQKTLNGPHKPSIWGNLGSVQRVSKARDMGIENRLEYFLGKPEFEAVRLVVTDDLTLLMSKVDPSTFEFAQNALEMWRTSAIERDVTLLFALPSGRYSTKYAVDSPTSRWSGSYAFFKASTSLTLEPAKHNTPNCAIQNLWTTPENGATERFELEFSPDRTEYVAQVAPIDSKTAAPAPDSEVFRALDELLRAKPPYTVFETSVVVQWALERGISRARSMVWLKTRSDPKTPGHSIEKLRHGTYQRVSVQ